MQRFEPPLPLDSGHSRFQFLSFLCPHACLGEKEIGKRTNVLSQIVFNFAGDVKRSR
jgi:hypothetical protein